MSSADPASYFSKCRFKNGRRPVFKAITLKSQNQAPESSGRLCGTYDSLEMEILNGKSQGDLQLLFLFRKMHPRKTGVAFRALRLGRTPTLLLGTSWCTLGALNYSDTWGPTKFRNFRYFRHFCGASCSYVTRPSQKYSRKNF